MMHFTTLFDSYYLDKALCMYRSLEHVTEDFSLYIFCFDAKSKEVLEAENLKHAVLLSHEDLEKAFPKLLELKKERSKAEYCWTCTPASIEYVLTNYNVPHCVYIDADLYFFADPKVLLAEAEGFHTIITPHRFTKSLFDQRHLKRSGKYCVEFNYFDQSKEAREALTWWREQCFEWCYHLYEPERMGDQKYLEKFPSLFQGVHELTHLGGGVAPWNLKQYEVVPGEDITLQEKSSGKTFPLVFYHFQNLRYLSERKVNASSGTHHKPTKDAIYVPYLREIEACRKTLKKYGVTFSVKKVYSSNKFIAFLQGNVLRFKVRSLSDIYDLDKI